MIIALSTPRRFFLLPNRGLNLHLISYTSFCIHRVLACVRVCLGVHASARNQKNAFYHSMPRKSGHMSKINDNILTNLLLTAFLHFCYTSAQFLSPILHFNIIYGIMHVLTINLTFTIDLSTTRK